MNLIDSERTCKILPRCWSKSIREEDATDAPTRHDFCWLKERDTVGSTGFQDSTTSWLRWAFNHRPRQCGVENAQLLTNVAFKIAAQEMTLRIFEVTPGMQTSKSMIGIDVTQHEGISWYLDVFRLRWHVAGIELPPAASSLMGPKRAPDISRLDWLFCVRPCCGFEHVFWKIWVLHSVQKVWNDAYVFPFVSFSFHGSTVCRCLLFKCLALLVRLRSIIVKHKSHSRWLNQGMLWLKSAIMMRV